MTLDAPSTPATSAPARSGPEPVSRLHSVTVLLATAGVLLALGGLFWGTRSLSTPTQDCGTSFSFLLDGRINLYVDPSDPPTGITDEAARSNNAEPCQERAANRAWPAGALVVGGTFLAAGAVLLDVGVRVLRYYRTVHMPPVQSHRPI